MAYEVLDRYRSLISYYFSFSHIVRCCIRFKISSEVVEVGQFLSFFLNFKAFFGGADVWEISGREFFWNGRGKFCIGSSGEKSKRKTKSKTRDDCCMIWPIKWLDSFLISVIEWVFLFFCLATLVHIQHYPLASNAQISPDTTRNKLSHTQQIGREFKKKNRWTQRRQTNMQRIKIQNDYNKM